MSEMKQPSEDTATVKVAPSESVIISAAKQILDSSDLGACSSVLKRLYADLQSDSMPHVLCTGDIHSYIALPHATIAAGRAFTITMWLNFHDTAQHNNISIVKCINSAGSGFELVMSNSTTKNHFHLELKTHLDGRFDSSSKHSEFMVIPNKYCMLSLCVVASRSKPSLSTAYLLVNDFKVFDISNVHYPFSSAPSDFKWQFCCGFQGKVSSITMYDREIGLELLSLLCDLGHHMSSLDCGVTCPQSSFDTSVNILGTLITKGALAAKCCSSIPLFCLTAQHVANGLLTYSVQGKVFAEHIEMITPSNSDRTLFPQLMGDYTTVLGPSWADCWWFSGSSNLVLKLLWAVCSSPQLLSHSLEDVSDFLSNTLALLAAVVRSSPTHREAFLQGHSFHVLSLCLEELAEGLRRSRIPCAESTSTDQLSFVHSRSADESVISTELVDRCFDLLGAFGLDGHKGDVLAASLQGLLLNMPLWTQGAPDTVDYLLTRVIAVVYSDSGEELYSSIGIQRILDILRVYIAPDNDEISLPKSYDASLHRLVSTGFRLLSVAFETAFDNYSHTQDTDIMGIDLLIVALDNTLHVLLVEGLLSVLDDMRTTCPVQLIRAFKANNFIETTCILLLCRADITLTVRRYVVTLMLWYLNDISKTIPADMYRLRYKFMLLYNQSLNPPSVANLRKAKFRLNVDGTQEQYKPLASMMTKYWQVAFMLSECLLFSLETCDLNSSSEESSSALADDILELFSEEGELGHLPVWIVLPFYSVLFSRCSQTLAQRILLSICVALKTDEGYQCEVFCSLQDISWMNLILDIALYGLGELSDEKKAMMNTCSEMSIDAVIIIIEHKIRFHDEESWALWKVLSDRISAVATPIVCERLLKRCSSILLQRLTRGTSKWQYTLIANVGKILSLMEEYRVMGNSSVSDEILASAKSEHNVLGLEYVRSEESLMVRDVDKTQLQLIGHMIDIMGKIRMSSRDHGFGGYELAALQPGLRILFGCLVTNSDELSDLVCHELYSFMKYMASSGVVCSSEDFDRFILVIFSMLKFAISNPNMTESIRGKYTALVYSYLHHFYDLKFTFIHSGKHVPDHVVHVMNIVTTIDANNVDIEIIFKLFNISMQTEETIDFVDESVESPGAILRQDSHLADFLTPRKEDMTDNDANEALPSEGIFWTATMMSPVSVNDVDESMEDSFDLTPSVLKSSESTSFFFREPLRLKVFLNWKQRRLALANKHIAFEHDRLKKFKRGVSFKAKCTRRLLMKVLRKLDSEVLQVMSTESQWKLGTDEGNFPGRYRVVLRRKYNTKDEHGSSNKELENSLSVEKINEVLVNYIQKPSTAEYATQDDVVESEDVVEEEEEEGKSSAVDMSTVEDDFQEGARIVTGPCHSGARRSNFGAVRDEAEVTLITPSGNYTGVIAFSRKDLSFISSNSLMSDVDLNVITVDTKKKFSRRRWTLSAISQIFLRRYRLRDSALEVFFRRGKHRNFFIDFGHTQEDARRRNEFARNLMKLAPKSAFKHWPSMSPYRIASELGVLTQWQQGEISNYEYLMALNTCAGRSFNDLCQYPVMPWILSDYDSSSIDLADTKVYRDLSKPMGAQNPERLKEYIERYESFSSDGGPEIPPFHYGSHYSTMVGVVLHYLVRLQPFASLHCDVQDGFDVPDRLFSSVQNAYYQNTHVLSEVKELTPEWFMLPDFLRNINKFDFGTSHDNRKIEDVDLPPWADGSPEKFIRINREALESEYVSANLHRWIDLVFGYKQLGKDAVDATNVFYYLTYYGAVDTSQLTDEVRRATELQVAHFGSHPMQLFRYPHPEKRKRSVPRPLRNCFDSVFSRMILPETQEEALSIDSCSTLVIRSPSSRILKCSICVGRIVCVLDNGVIEAYRYGLSEVIKQNLTSEQQAQSLNSTRRKIAESAPVRAMKKYSEKTSLELRQLSNRIALESSELKRAFTDRSTSLDETISRPHVDPESMQNRQNRAYTVEASWGDATTSAALPTKQTKAVSHSPPSPKSPKTSMNMVVLVDKDHSPFSVLPRIPLATVNRSSRLSNKLVLDLAKLTVVSNSGRMLFSAGHIDGRVVVREVELLTCEIIHAADFRAHSYPVCCLATDCISDGLTDVVASIDLSGLLMIWTVSRVVGRGILSRRPQRLFRCPRSEYVLCDLSWSMGIVAVSNKDLLTVFSIEKNEMIHKWAISNASDSSSSAAFTPGGTEAESVGNFTLIVRKLVLSSEGFIVMAIQCLTSDLAASSYYLASFTLAGVRAGVYSCSCPVTFLSCHQRNSVVIAGFYDGTVEFLSASCVEVLFSFAPHVACVSYEGDQSTVFQSTESNAIINVQINLSLICVSAISGHMFCRALPDFVKYESDRNTSSFAKLVKNPIQTVQQHAQTISDAASTLKVHLDETFGELKKIDKAKILSGVSSFFGIKKESNPPMK